VARDLAVRQRLRSFVRLVVVALRLFGRDGDDGRRPWIDEVDEVLAEHEVDVPPRE
jgi:hypothetical protein